MNTEIKILGKTYAVRSEFGESFMMETANLVNGRMQELMTKTGSVATEKIAVLTAMNLAGEFLKLKQDDEKLKQNVQEKIKKVLKMVDNHLES